MQSEQIFKSTCPRELMWAASEILWYQGLVFCYIIWQIDYEQMSLTKEKKYKSGKSYYYWYLYNTTYLLLICFSEGL